MRRNEALKVGYWVSPEEDEPLIVPSKKSPSRPIGALNREFAGGKEAHPKNRGGTAMVINEEKKSWNDGRIRSAVSYSPKSEAADSKRLRVLVLLGFDQPID